MANLSTLTAQQLAKLTQRPNWLSVDSAIGGRVFPSNEGWMLSPTKVHPEGKRMPAECVMAIPNLSEYMEETGAPDAADPQLIFMKSVSITRRSRSRYIVNFAFDEVVANINANDDIHFGFDPARLFLTVDGVSGPGTSYGSNTLNPIPDFMLRAGETAGRIQMDLNFNDPVENVIMTQVMDSNNFLSVNFSGSATPSDLVSADNHSQPVEYKLTDLSNVYSRMSGDRWDSTLNNGTITIVP